MESRPRGSAGGRHSETLMADNETAACFTFLPGVLAAIPDEAENSTRDLRLQRGALGALGICLLTKTRQRMDQVDSARRR